MQLHNAIHTFVLAGLAFLGSVSAARADNIQVLGKLGNSGWFVLTTVPNQAEAERWAARYRSMGYQVNTQGLAAATARDALRATPIAPTEKKMTSTTFTPPAGTATQPQLRMPTAVNLTGSWHVFDYSVEPVQRYDILIVRLEGTTVFYQKHGSLYRGSYDFSRHEIVLGAVRADVRVNAAGRLVMNGIGGQGARTFNWNASQN